MIAIRTMLALAVAGLGYLVRVSTGRSAIPGSIGDFGWVGIHGTQFWVDPKEHMYVDA